MGTQLFLKLPPVHITSLCEKPCRLSVISLKFLLYNNNLSTTKRLIEMFLACYKSNSQETIFIHVFLGSDMCTISLRRKHMVRNEVPLPEGNRSIVFVLYEEKL